MPVQKHFSLSVKIIEARNLISADRNGLSDPYCKIFVGGKLAAKSNMIRYTLDPKWNEEFVIHPSGEHDVLLVEVWDWDRLSSDDPLGNCVIPLSDCIRGVEYDGWYHLEDVPHGQIKIGLNPIDFGAVQGKLIAPGSDPSVKDLFGERWCIKSTKFYPIQAGKDTVNFEKYAGKFVRVKGRTIRNEVEGKKNPKMYIDHLVVGELELLE